MSDRKAKAKRDIIFIMIMVVVLVAGFYFMSKNHRFENLYGFNEYATDKRAQAELDAELAFNNPVANEFDNFRQDFLKSLYNKAASYKKRRAVIVDLVEPENLQQASYIEENYALMEQLVPELNQRMNAVMAVFSDADSLMLGILAQGNPTSRAVLGKKWDNLKKEQMGLFVDYFKIEQEIIQNYRNMMGVYYQNRNNLQVNPETTVIAFDDPVQANRIEALKSLIIRAEERQGALFNN